MTKPKAATATIPILCFYRVWSAYKDLGFVDGAKMIHVSRAEDVPLEFEVQMDKEARRGAKFLAIDSPCRWILKAAYMRDGTLITIDQVATADYIPGSPFLTA